MQFSVPTDGEYKRLIEGYPFDDKLLKEDFKYTVHIDGSFESFHAYNQIDAWHNHLFNRMIQTRWSWIYLTYFYEKGIPDDRWFVSPGKKGQTVEYFPDFEEKHFLIKTQFDYFSDIFYYKLFSAWDTLGHVLNYMYGLETERPTFYKIVVALKKVRPNLYSILKDLIESDDFGEMREFRHSVTHNELLGHLGSFSTKVSEGEYALGIGKYTTSSQIKDNANKSLELFSKAIESIKIQIIEDTI